MRRLRRSTLAAIGGLALSSVVGGCGSDAGEAAPGDCTPIVGGKTTLVARNLAWDEDCLRVLPGTEVTFTVRLEDVAVKHDLEITGPSGRAKTDLESGPTTQTLRFPFPEDGRHRFVCTIHTPMEGDIYVEEVTK